MPASLSTTDAELLRSLHDEHGAALWRFVTHLLDGDRIRAQDVVQETFLRAWRHPEVLDTSAGSPRAWLFTVARNLVIDGHRTAVRRPEVLPGELPEVGTDGAQDEVLDRELLLAALATLSPQHREVVVECYVRGNSVVEVAERLDVPPGTVKSRCHYALRALRAFLEEQEAPR